MKKSNLRWATKTFVLSIFLSIFFSVISQSMFPSLPPFISIFVIFFFIIVSVIFDMIAVSVTSMDIKKLDGFKGKKGYETAIKLCQNTEKISSFCGDVVGDICGILSGAGGVSLVVSLNIYDANLYFIITCLVSSLIAGLTIFGKAIMKTYSVEHCEQVVIKTCQILETSPFSIFRNLFKTKKKETKKYNVESESNQDNKKNEGK